MIDPTEFHGQTQNPSQEPRPEKEAFHSLDWPGPSILRPSTTPWKQPYAPIIKPLTNPSWTTLAMVGVGGWFLMSLMRR